MAQKEKSTGCFQEDSGLNSGPNLVAHNYLELQFQKIYALFWLLQEPDKHAVYIKEAKYLHTKIY